MKTRALLFLLITATLSAYEARKIDMHGGKETPLYKAKKDFQPKAFGISAFRETNTTKKSGPTKK